MDQDQYRELQERIGQVATREDARALRQELLALPESEDRAALCEELTMTEVGQGWR